MSFVTKSFPADVYLPALMRFRMEFIAKEGKFPAGESQTLCSTRQNVPTAFDSMFSIQQPQHRFYKRCLQLTLPAFYTEDTDGMLTIK